MWHVHPKTLVGVQVENPRRYYTYSHCGGIFCLWNQLENDTKASGMSNWETLIGSQEKKQNMLHRIFLMTFSVDDFQRWDFSFGKLNVPKCHSLNLFWVPQETKKIEMMLCWLLNVCDKCWIWQHENQPLQRSDQISDAKKCMSCFPGLA